MKAVRWILVLPGAYGAAKLMHITCLATAWLMPDFVVECMQNFFGSIAYVGAAYMIAPNHKVTAAIVVTTLCVFVTILDFFLTFQHTPPEIVWWKFVTFNLLAIIGSIMGCATAAKMKKDEEEKQTAEAQRN